MGLTCNHIAGALFRDEAVTHLGFIIQHAQKLLANGYLTGNCLTINGERLESKTRLFFKKRVKGWETDGSIEKNYERWLILMHDHWTFANKVKDIVIDNLR